MVSELTNADTEEPSKSITGTEDATSAKLKNINNFILLFSLFISRMNL